MAEPLTEVLFRTQYAGLYRTAFGRLFRWVIEAKAEDLAGGNLPAFVAAVAWNSVHRLNKRYGWKLKPWEVAGYILDLLALALKEAGHRVDIPHEFLTTYTLAMGIGVDAGFGGLIDGVRIRAKALLEEWSRKMRQKNNELKDKGEKMTQDHRREIIGAAAFDSAERFLSSGLELSDSIEGEKAEDGKRRKSDEPTSKKEQEMSITVKIGELKRSADEASRKRSEGLEGLLTEYQARDPAQSAVVIAASVDGRVPVDAFMNALEESQALRVKDPETDTEMSAQAYALTKLYRKAEKKMADDKKPDEKDGDKKKEGDKPKTVKVTLIKGILEPEVPDPATFVQGIKDGATSFKADADAARRVSLKDAQHEKKVVGGVFDAYAHYFDGFKKIWPFNRNKKTL